MTDTDALLAERGERYGEFHRHAGVTQQLKLVMKQHRCGNHVAPAWRKVTDDQREALEMIAHKIGRILNGDPNYADSWADIAGYAKLVADRLEASEGAPGAHRIGGQTADADASAQEANN